MNAQVTTKDGQRHEGVQGGGTKGKEGGWGGGRRGGGGDEGSERTAQLERGGVCISLESEGLMHYRCGVACRPSCTADDPMMVRDD